MTIAIGIPHTPWIAQRGETFDRLTASLGLPRDGIQHRHFTEREPNWSWSVKLWQWGWDSGADYLLQLQDDVRVDRQFWPHLHQMLAQVPDQIIGLESVHPVSQFLYAQGSSWYTTTDGLIGVGYVIPRSHLASLLEWRETCLRPNAAQSISEDTLIDVFALSTGRKIWHPVPTIIDHDTSLQSTYGNDWHSHRKPLITTVRGDAPKAEWVVRPETLHVGRFYDMTPRLARRWVKGFHMADFERAMADRFNP